MRYLFVFFMLLCTTVYGQTGSKDVVYTKEVYSLKGKSIADNGGLFVKGNKNEFFSLFMYGRHEIAKGVDTSGAGYLRQVGDTTIAQCVWAYIADKNTCDVLKGEVLFYNAGNKAMLLLRNMKYYKYEKQGAVFVLKSKGDYKDLDVCSHCSTSGIVIGEMVQGNFLHLSNMYRSYIMRGLKNQNK